MNALETPVLLLIFNRPDHTRQVMERIREVKPKFLFVGGDGPRINHPTDIERCEQARNEVTNRIDWPCNVKTLFREKNLGCGRAPAEAITWFFDQVEAGIILEDDCLPSMSFFGFCQVLLEDYKSAEKVMTISGFNYFGKWQNKKHDFFFSDGGNWGWASWRRAWKLFDFSMSTWRTIDSERRTTVEKFYPDFDSIYQSIIFSNYDAWDIQWHYARLYYNGLSITPTLNLVSNIGFDKLATHTRETDSFFAKVPSFELDFKKKLRGPAEFKLDTSYRLKLLKASKTSNNRRYIAGLFNRITRKLKFKLSRFRLD